MEIFYDINGFKDIKLQIICCKGVVVPEIILDVEKAHGTQENQLAHKHLPETLP